MLQLSAQSSGQKGQLSEFLKTWMSKKPTLETNTDLADTITINAHLIVGGAFQNTAIRMLLDGTSKTVLHGKTQSIIAGKLEDTVILEIHTRKENIEPQFQDQDCLFGWISNPVLIIRTIDKSLYGLTVGAHRVSPLGAILCADREELFLYLELKATDTE